jgi:hypothetical protein
MKFNRKCKYCTKPFETNSSIKDYCCPEHQRKANNNKQNEKRHKLNILNKPLMETYKIYDKLLGIKSLVRFSKEYLRGKGADLSFYTKTVHIEGKYLNGIFDILLFNDNDYLTLKRIKK